MVEALQAALAALSGWEVAAVVLAIAYLLLAVREHPACWPCALASTAIYTVLLWHVSLLMESALNVYYMAMAVYGWWAWRRGDAGNALAITSWRARQHAVAIGTIAALTLASGAWLSAHSNAAWPFLDSFTTWGAVLTTWMVARKVLENWLYWLVLDAVSIPLYVDRGLVLTAALFAIYLVLAVIGFLTWHRHYAASADAVVAT
ncbi:MAG: nicotinamide mononucleotide transporter [Planctomycetes bacterium]|nr:nicotinamide mononucleotide transporter [Planctomycetota bacterium]